MELAAQFAAALPPLSSNDSSALRLYLKGELGSGKTTWVRGLLRALGVTQPIPSPSYALLLAYEARGWQCLHLDCYRLNDPAELDALGLDDFDRAQCLWLIEWPERAALRLGAPDLELRFEAGVEAHQLCARAYSARGAAWLGAFSE
jgi:tRNA threonylcarbamoyladenosine biosynthesis protein TsaE